MKTMRNETKPTSRLADLNESLKQLSEQVGDLFTAKEDEFDKQVKRSRMAVMKAIEREANRKAKP